MPRMTQARRNSLEAARLAQKRARDKEYRLRKRGAAMVGEYSPRLNWNEVKQMNTRELRSYSKKLGKFSAEHSKVLQSGEVLPEKIIRKINANIRVHNLKAAKERAKIDKVKAKLPTVGERFVKTRASVGIDPNTMKPYVETEVGTTGSALQPIVQSEMPENIRQAMSRLRKSEQWARPNFRKIYRTQRKSAISMLKMVRLDDVAEAVGSMSELAFSVAVNRYGLFDELEVWYTDNQEVLDWQISRNRTEYEGFTSRMRDMVSALAQL